MSLEPDEKELKKIRKNKAKAEQEFEEISPIIKARKYKGSLGEIYARSYETYPWDEDDENIDAGTYDWGEDESNFDNWAYDVEDEYEEDE